MYRLIARITSSSSSLRSSIPRLSVASPRTIRTVSDDSGEHTESEVVEAPSVRFPGFAPVFISPHIRQIRVACRLKIYQTGFVVCLLPTSLGLLQTGYLMPSQVGYVAGNDMVSTCVKEKPSLSHFLTNSRTQDLLTTDFETYIHS